MISTPLGNFDRLIKIVCFHSVVTVDIIDLTKESDDEAEKQLDSNIKGSDTYLSDSDDSLIDEQISSR